MKNSVIRVIFFLTVANLFMCCDKGKKVIDCSLVYGTLVDPRDGSRYSTVTVCDATWMTQNLRYEVPGVLKEPSSSGVEYGFLYNYEQANKACPEEWHLATDTEWKTLEAALGISAENIDLEGWRGDQEGQFLKSSTQWEKKGKVASPISFRALPAGYSDGTYQGLGELTRFWTSSESGAERGVMRELATDQQKIKRASSKKTNYYSCRCVMD